MPFVPAGLGVDRAARGAGEALPTAHPHLGLEAAPFTVSSARGLSLICVLGGR